MISSQQIFDKKLSEVVEIAMKFLKKNICHSEPTLLAPLVYKINTHNISGVEKLSRNPDCIKKSTTIESKFW